jgi:DNA invertase Pin-like site-specific DNA recombinase
MRFAIYVRTSSEMQSELSLEQQEVFCREAVTERGGTVVRVFRDYAQSGWTLERAGFMALREAAQRGEFDALMLWKFDRLARSHEHSIIIRTLLRNEYGVKIYCVEGVSQDDTDSPFAAFVEEVFAIFAAFYSQTVSSDVRRSKRSRAINGEFNGSKPPFGYDMVFVTKATPERPAGLHINPEQARLVKKAFEFYATGNHGDLEIADWLNEQPIVQAFRAGKRPFDKEFVRGMLQNRTYTGRVSYAETEYGGGELGGNRKSSRYRRQWFEGKHEAIIDDELFRRCQRLRRKSAHRPTVPSQTRVYLLSELLWCERCFYHKPEHLADKIYGKMKSVNSTSINYPYYRCQTSMRGYQPCGQLSAPTEVIDEQVVQLLSNLHLPDKDFEQVRNAVQRNLDDATVNKRIEKLQTASERIDLSWQGGLIDPIQYQRKKQRLERILNGFLENEQLDQDRLTADSLLRNFAQHFAECNNQLKPDVARRQLIRWIVEKILIYDRRVTEIHFWGGYILKLS